MKQWTPYLIYAVICAVSFAAGYIACIKIQDTRRRRKWYNNIPARLLRCAGLR